MDHLGTRVGGHQIVQAKERMVFWTRHHQCQRVEGSGWIRYMVSEVKQENLLISLEY